MLKAYVFPGQGSQRIGMGEGLFDQYDDMVKKADSILGYSIKTLCLKDPDKQVNQTQFTQPALYVVSALSYMNKIEETEQEPDYLAGHSLGEYNALFASGAIDFETGLKLVKKRGELMSMATGGGMAAVIGVTPERIEEVLNQNELTSIGIANYNAPSQTVISGRKDDIQRANEIFKQEKIMFIPLNVSAAFHSKYMQEARENFANYLDQFDFQDFIIPVISNFTARPYVQKDIKKNMIEQITGSVRWTESICYLRGLGEIEFEEVGPGNVLTNIIGKIEKEAEPLVDMDFV